MCSSVLSSNRITDKVRLAWPEPDLNSPVMPGAEKFPSWKLLPPPNLLLLSPSVFSARGDKRGRRIRKEKMEREERWRKKDNEGGVDSVGEIASPHFFFSPASQLHFLSISRFHFPYTNFPYTTLFSLSTVPIPHPSLAFTSLPQTPTLFTLFSSSTVPHPSLQTPLHPPHSIPTPFFPHFHLPSTNSPLRYLPEYRFVPAQGMFGAGNRPRDTRGRRAITIL